VAGMDERLSPTRPRHTYDSRGTARRQLSYNQTRPFEREGGCKESKAKGSLSPPCNQEWMGTLQRTTKPILLPLLTRERDIIQPHERETLAAWATVFALVYASSMPDYATQNSSQRRTFMRDKAPPSYWMYWCAPFDGLSSPAFHFRMVQAKNNWPMTSGDDAGDASTVVDLTVCGAGGICFVIFGSNAQSGFQKFSELVAVSVASAGFVQFWPSDITDVRVSGRRSAAFDALSLLAFRNGLVNAMAGVRR
jgi:hypothetical protein